MKKVILLLAFTGLSMVKANFYMVNSIDLNFNSINEFMKRIEVKKIVNAIKYVESRNNYNITGKSGEFGAYQIMPSTWELWCYKYFGTILEKTPKNQDTIAFLKVYEWVNKGYTLKEIAFLWNAGTIKPKRYYGYNSKGVYFNVLKYYEKIKQAYENN